MDYEVVWIELKNSIIEKRDICLEHLLTSEDILSTVKTQIRVESYNHVLKSMRDMEYK